MNTQTKTFVKPDMSTDPFAWIVLPHLTTERIEAALAEGDDPAMGTLAQRLARQFVGAVPSSEAPLFEPNTPESALSLDVKAVVYHTPRLISSIARMVEAGYRALPGQLSNAEPNV